MGTQSSSSRDAKKPTKASTSSAQTAHASSPQLSRLQGWKQWVGIVLLIIGGLSFFMAQSASWISTGIFDQQTFVETTGKVLDTEESRRDIATIIIDRSLEDRPIIKKVAGSQATNLLTGMLGSDLAANAYQRLANGVYAYITSPNQQDITVDLTSIKAPISGIVSFAENRGREVKLDPSQIPDQIVLIDEAQVPDLSGYIRTILVLNALFWLVTIICFAWYVFLQDTGRVRRLYQVLAVLAATIIISLASAPFVPPAIASFISLIQARGIATSLTEAFLAPFYTRMWMALVVIGIVALALALRHQAWRGVQYVITTLDGSRKSSKK